MKKTLKDCDVEFIAIPSFGNNGEIISASKVIKLIKNRNLNEI